MSRYGAIENRSGRVQPKVNVKFGKGQLKEKGPGTFKSKTETKLPKMHQNKREQIDNIRLQDGWDYATSFTAVDDDPNSMQIDMLEEANHRVYYGFFHLDWLNQHRRFSDLRGGVNRTVDENESRSYINLSTIARGQANSSLRGFGSGTQTRRFLDNSLEGSGRGHSRGARTINIDQSFATTEFPHVCSLYHQPNTDTSMYSMSRHKYLTSKTDRLQ